MKRALVIGYGSIGKRHVKILLEMEFDLAVVSRRQIDFPKTYKTIGAATSEWQPEYVVIASRTEEHANDLAALQQSGFNGRVLVEKPLIAVPSDVTEKPFLSFNVAYNLRFHPLMDALRDALEGQKILAMTVHIGHYLGDWRPGTDYRDSYSAGHAGGGVLRDLSHELDYVLWLMGAWKRVAALGGKLSQLDIESDDIMSILMETERCPAVSIHMNYLQKSPQRDIVIMTQDETLRADFIAGTFSSDADSKTVDAPDNLSYQRQHEAINSDQPSHACTVEQGLAVVHIIEAIERALVEEKWVTATDIV